MYFEGVDYDGLRQSICREFGIGSIEKSASVYNAVLDPLISGVSSSASKAPVAKGAKMVAGTVVGKSAAKVADGAKAASGFLDSAVAKVSLGTLTGLGVVGLGSQAYAQYREKTQPLYKQLANPNSGLGSTARAAAGIGGALLAASMMNEMSRGRHGSTLI
jgi:hypothetical protein